eukprot:SAG31_NODE_6779_length_1892_cov_1.511991_1_plen_69_part_00
MPTLRQRATAGVHNRGTGEVQRSLPRCGGTVPLGAVAYAWRRQQRDSSATAIEVVFAEAAVPYLWVQR